MADQARRRPGTAARSEARSVARLCEPTLVSPTASVEPQGYYHDGAEYFATRSRLGLSKMRGTVTARCPARHRQRDTLAAAIRRTFSRHACRPARTCRIVADVGATPASHCNRHCQEQIVSFACLSRSLAAG